MAQRPIRGPLPDLSGYEVFPHYSSKAEYDAASLGKAAEAGHVTKQVELAGGRDALLIEGYCALCQRDVTFAVNSSFSPGEPNWRESTFCNGCGLSARMRFAFHVLIQQFALVDQADNYLAEAFSRSARWLKGRFPRLTSSEFLSPRAQPGQMTGGIRHEDLQKLSFADASLDTVMHFEVLEHVPYLDLATAEMARVLRPGGRLFFTAPFRLDKASNIELASMEPDGSITDHVLPREIHGNPADPANGALCYRHFGWDYLDQLEEAGFRDAKVIAGWSRELGYMGVTVIITAVRA